MAPQHMQFDLGPATDTPTPTGFSGTPVGAGLAAPPGLAPPPGLNPSAASFQPASNMSAAQQLKDKLMNGNAVLLLS